MSDIDDSNLDGLGLDDALRADLRLAGHLDEVPPETLAAAKASFLWRTIDAELAQLVEDSAEDDNVLAGVRSTGTVRMLTFQSPTLTVEVEAIEVGNRRRLVGLLVPPRVARVEVRHGRGTLTVEADELGRFSADDVAPGPVSLRCLGPAGVNAVTTDWVVV